MLHLRRQLLRRHVRLLMEQLEEVLAELKDVAREMREVVADIDKLTSDIDPGSEDDRSEERGGSARDIYIKTVSRKHELTHLLHNPRLDTVRRLSGVKKQDVDFCHRSCGDLPALNGPLSAARSPTASWLFGSGGRLHYYDKSLYHALCCDDDDDDDDEDEETTGGGMRPSRLSSCDSVFSSTPPRFLTPKCSRKPLTGPDARNRSLRSCSTQTVSDKSTQTSAPLMQDQQRAIRHYKKHMLCYNIIN